MLRILYNKLGLSWTKLSHSWGWGDRFSRDEAEVYEVILELENLFWLRLSMGQFYTFIVSSSSSPSSFSFSYCHTRGRSDQLIIACKSALADKLGPHVALYSM